MGHSSGDTGVSASLTLHGTPPFQVYYRIQRDQEPPHEFPKTFATSRGELTLQPDRSGHYTFTFFQISDTYYKRVELDGPSIDQVIHPLAGADFVATTTYQSGKRRKISSCEGNMVSVDVGLKVLTTSLYCFVFNDVAFPIRRGQVPGISKSKLLVPEVRTSSRFGTSKQRGKPSMSQYLRVWIAMVGHLTLTSVGIESPATQRMVLIKALHADSECRRRLQVQTARICPRDHCCC